jgi:hypothetical protein
VFKETFKPCPKHILAYFLHFSQSTVFLHAGKKSSKSVPLPMPLFHSSLHINGSAFNQNSGLEDIHGNLWTSILLPICNENYAAYSTCLI